MTVHEYIWLETDRSKKYAKYKRRLSKKFACMDPRVQACSQCQSRTPGLFLEVYDRHPDLTPFVFCPLCMEIWRESLIEKGHW